MEKIRHQSRVLQSSPIHTTSGNWAGLVPRSGRSTNCIGRPLWAVIDTTNALGGKPTLTAPPRPTDLSPLPAIDHVATKHLPATSAASVGAEILKPRLL